MLKGTDDQKKPLKIKYLHEDKILHLQWSQLILGDSPMIASGHLL